MNRRRFIQTSLGTLAASSITSQADTTPTIMPVLNKNDEPIFEISLAEWSLHKKLFMGALKNIDFPKYAKDKFGITAVEYVNIFFKDKAKDKAYLTDLKKRTDDEGIRNVLIMCDAEGNIGANTEEGRDKTVDNHKKWVEAAKFLGCHSIRVNAHGGKGKEEAAKRVVEGLTKLSTFAKDFNINIIVENHGGYSSDGAWLKKVLETVNMPNCGSLPDFGNFYEYDRYQGIKDLLPFAKGISAKSNHFNAEGDETKTDFAKAMKICLDGGYRGYVGVEWEGKGISEDKGILLTKALLEKVRKEYSAR